MDLAAMGLIFDPDTIIGYQERLPPTATAEVLHLS